MCIRLSNGLKLERSPESQWSVLASLFNIRFLLAQAPMLLEKINRSCVLVCVHMALGLRVCVHMTVCTRTCMCAYVTMAVYVRLHVCVWVYVLVCWLVPVVLHGASSSGAAWGCVPERV